MAKKKVSELEALAPEEVLRDEDLLYISKTEAESPDFISKKISANRFAEELANYDVFVTSLIENETFTTNLANNENFYTSLVDNTDFTTYLANNENFYTSLVDNENFTTYLANDENFYTSLVDNENFTTYLANNSNFVTELTENTDFITNIVNEIEVLDEWVNTAGDRMTGTLEFQHPSATDEFVIQPTAAGDLSISPTNFNDNLFLSISNVDPVSGGTGSVVAGRFRCSIPISSAVDTDILESGASASALIEYNSASAGTIYIRKNNGTSGDDFFLGNYFSVMQRGAGAPTLVGQTANVHLLIPTGFIASPRGQYSVITATLVQVDVTAGPSYDDEYWLISGDLATDA